MLAIEFRDPAVDDPGRVDQPDVHDCFRSD
jgi:hypothetical protein